MKYNTGVFDGVTLAHRYYSDVKYLEALDKIKY